MRCTMGTGEGRMHACSSPVASGKPLSQLPETAILVNGGNEWELRVVSQAGRVLILNVQDGILSCFMLSYH